jgi:hypothetical protein
MYHPFPAKDQNRIQISLRETAETQNQFKNNKQLKIPKLQLESFKAQF